MNIIGTRLRELRQSAKLSQVKIAEVVGSRQSAIARFESGEAHVPAEVIISMYRWITFSAVRTSLKGSCMKGK